MQFHRPPVSGAAAMLVAAVILSLPLAAQQTITVGSIRLTIPAVWKATSEANGAMQIVPATGPADFVMILSAGTSPGADSAGVHDSLLARLSMKKRGSNSVITSRDGTRFLTTNAEFDAAGKAVRGALATAHSGRNWVAAAALTDSRLRWFLLEPDFRRLMSSAETILNTASADGAIAQPTFTSPAQSSGTSTSATDSIAGRAAPPERATSGTSAARGAAFGDGHGVAGVYVGVGRGFRLGVTGLEIGSVDRALVLLSDGSSTDIIPPDGFDALDLPWYHARYPSYFRPWTQRGKQIVIQDGERATTYRVDGETLFEGDDASSSTFARASTSTGRTFKGTYALHSWKPADFADPKYFPYGMMHITFAADGTFEDVGQVKTIFSVPATLPYPGEAFFDRLKTPSKGRYRVATNTLYLNYEDGRELALAFWVPPGAGTGLSPSVIVVNRYVLTLRP